MMECLWVWLKAILGRLQQVKYATCLELHSELSYGIFWILPFYVKGKYSAGRFPVLRIKITFKDKPSISEANGRNSNEMLILSKALCRMMTWAFQK